MTKRGRDRRKLARKLKFDYVANGIIPPDVFYGLPMEAYLKGWRFDFSKAKIVDNNSWAMPLLKDGQPLRINPSDWRGVYGSYS